MATTSSTTTAGGVEYLELTSDSLAAQQSHRLILLDIEARKRAATIDVPTLAHDVRDKLRSMGEPIRLFGEDLAAIRDRLRMIMARWEVWREQQEKGLVDAQMEVPRMEVSSTQQEKVEITETTYTHASQELIDARDMICKYSLARSRNRLELERRRRRGMVRWTRQKKRARLFDKDDDDADENFGDMYNEDNLKQDAVLVKNLDNNCEKIYSSIRSQALEGSQYGDVRPLSAVCTSSLGGNSNHLDYTGSLPKIIATGGWSGGIKIWNGGNDHRDNVGDKEETTIIDEVAPLDLLGSKNIVHEDRIMGIAMKPYLTSATSTEGLTTMVASASIDLSAKLCKVSLNEDAADSMDVDDDNKAKGNQQQQLRYKIEECAHLKGHAARLCSVAFHPLGRYVATTSFDHTWRLWDVETSSMSEGKELLLQDGHAREVYGVGFHPDGSLVATTDFGGVVQCWDLRTGKSACHFLGHARRVICSEFSPNGFQLATAGDDGTIKIWDLRRRRPSASIPAHTNLITQLKFSHSTSSQNGEFLASSSFDGTGKMWSTRDWKHLTTLEGHEGKVMGIDVLDGRDCGVVTCGFDKTLKLWK